jgi:trans-aconitate 2-methyltransferase
MNPPPTGVGADRWDPARYERFRTERERPVHHLLGLVSPVPGGRAADLGCGNGRYTPWLHRRVEAAETVGIDSSARMLAGADPFAGDGVRFVEGDLAALGGLPGDFDVLFANASLQWVPDQESLLPHLVARLAPRGQLAFQVPANFDQPSHRIADTIGAELGLEPLDRAITALTPARYAEVLWHAGLRELDVTLRVYGVEMARTDHVVDWVSGTLLTRFEARLSADDYESFRAEYRGRLLDALGDPTGSSPYYYAFPRILCRGRLPG